MANTFAVFTIRGTFLSAICSDIIACHRTLDAMRYFLAVAFHLLGVRPLTEHACHLQKDTNPLQ